MHFEPRQSSVLVAVVYSAAAALSAASLWFVLSSAFSFDAAIRNASLSGMRSLLAGWALVCASGIIFAGLALRLVRLSIPLQRATLLASCGAAVVAGMCLEWWQSLYFLFPALVLALAFVGQCMPNLSLNPDASQAALTRRPLARSHR